VPTASGAGEGGRCGYGIATALVQCCSGVSPMLMASTWEQHPINTLSIPYQYPSNTVAIPARQPAVPAPLGQTERSPNAWATALPGPPGRGFNRIQHGADGGAAAGLHRGRSQAAEPVAPAPVGQTYRATALGQTALRGQDASAPSEGRRRESFSRASCLTAVCRKSEDSRRPAP
jgi:hypothetical protein